MIPIYIDASALKKTYCDRAFQQTVIKGRVPKEYREPFSFGNATHLYAKLRARNASFKDAMAEAVTYYNEHRGVEPDKLISVFTTYNPNIFGAFPAGMDAIACTEKFFKIPYREVTTSDGKVYIVFLCGTIDRIELHQDFDALCLIDFKTARNWDAHAVYQDYKLSVQFMFYYWVFRRYGNQILPEPLHKYLQNNRLFVCPSPIMISHKPPKWLKGMPISYDHLLGEMDILVEASVEAILSLASLEGLATPNGMISDQCSKCDFWPVCHSPLHSDGLAKEELLDNLYDKKLYDPENF